MWQRVLHRLFNPTMKQIQYDIKLRAETISTNTRLNDDKYSSWKAINIGSAPVNVYGVQLLPGEGLAFDLLPNEVWKEAIEITVQPGGAVRLLRKICTPTVVDVKEE